jgi:hypothetical protein
LRNFSRFEPLWSNHNWKRDRSRHGQKQKRGCGD